MDEFNSASTPYQEERKSSSEYPVLVAKNGPLGGRRWLIKSSITIGREPECDVVIPDRQVSRYHARLSLEDAVTLLEDLGSKNGTYLDGVRMDDNRFLEDGDIIQIALVQTFAYYASDATMPLEDKFPPVSISNSLVLEERSRRVFIKGTELTPPLSVSQFRLLEELYKQPGKVVRRDDLIAAIWEDESAAGVSEQALDALIRRLRDRLAEFDSDHQYIVTVRGHGLRLENKLKN
ncbi:MAG: FHA domain-containing protein [Anaerolineaceae bacterium]